MREENELIISDYTKIDDFLDTYLDQDMVQDEITRITLTKTWFKVDPPYNLIFFPDTTISKLVVFGQFDQYCPNL